MAYTQSQSRGIIYLVLGVLLWQCIFLVIRWKRFSPSNQQPSDWRTEMQQHFAAHPTDSLFPFDPNTASTEIWQALGLSAKQSTVAVRYLKRNPIKNKRELLQLFVIDSAFFQKIEPFVNITFATDRVFQNWNPNTVTILELKDLGLNDVVASRWVRYREKIGGFKTFDDLKKVYGVAEHWLASQKSYLLFEPKVETETLNDTTELVETIRERKIFEINNLDSVGWIQVKGIGSVFASRIVRYRQKLGGFVAVNQLLEVYGMDSARFVGIAEQLVVDTSKVQPININTVSEKALYSHPYITKKMAQELVQFRDSYRTFSRVEELLNFSFMDADLFRKIAPYLKTEN